MEHPILYPSLLERFKAIILDGFIIIIGLVIAGLIFSGFPDAPGFVRGSVFVLVFLLYEPIMVAMGGTIGHRVMGLRVKSYSDSSKNIMLPLSIIRSIVKWLLGWISFLSMIANEEKRAMHDLLSSSIILYKKDAEL